MFCIFTTRAEKRHLVQEMLTKNVEHVKMKKVRTFGIGQKYICGKEDTGMKTAEVLDQTETFETAGFDILNHVGKITQVDMPGRKTRSPISGLHTGTRYGRGIYPVDQREL